jgi:prepilin-type N-terminal cleavage/methylation domain-containing protein
MWKRGFTLTEFMVGIVVGAIVILMIAAIAQIATASYTQLRSRSGVYDDAQFAIDLVTDSVRRAVSASTSGSCLRIDDTDDSVNNPKNFYVNGNSLLYGTNACGSPTNTDTPIITGVSGLTFTPTVTVDLVHVVLSGTKSGITFTLSGDAKRRNP